MDGSTDVILRVLGRLHPVVVHFPIALLIAGGVLELLRSRREKPSEAGFFCLVLGALGAIVACWWGWLFAAFDHADMAGDRTLFLHRWAGIATAAVAAPTALIAALLRYRPWTRLLPFYRAGLFLSVLLVAYGAHLGGTMAFGSGYVLELFRQAPASEAPGAAPPAAADPADAPAATDPPPAAVVVAGEERRAPDGEAPADVASAGPPAAGGHVDYRTQVVPILEAKCFECHGPKGRAKGGLRLSDMEDVFSYEPEDRIIQPGDAAGSELVRRVELPHDDEDFMPKKGDPLTAAEIDLLRAWIDQGAEWEPLAPVGGEGAAPSEATGPSESAGAPGPGAVAPLSLSDADRARRDEALEAVLARGAFAGRVALDTDEVEVNLGLLRDEVTDADLALLDGLEPCLVSLDLSRTGVTDAGLARVARFARLRRLRLDGTGIGDAGLAHLTGLSALRYLNLVGTPVTDAGLESLGELAALEKLFVWETEVSAEAASALAETRPRLEVVRDTYVPAVADEETAVTSVPCCEAAAAAGKTCDHPCCVAAAAKGEPCPTCSVVGEAKE